MTVPIISKNMFVSMYEVINIFLSLMSDAINANIHETYIISTNHQGIMAPMGTRPSIGHTPAINKSVASKFLILNALYEADATKNARSANIVEQRDK